MSPLSEDQVRYELHGPCAVVTIDRPERRNAVDGPTADALAAAYERWVADEEARVMILTGAGPDAFCAGADLKAIESFERRITAGESPLGFTRLMAPKPVIAAIEGWCLAGGMELALWCDIRIAAASARFGFTERRFGVPLIDGGTQRLPRIVGLGRAMDLVLTGRVIETDEAREMGLVNEKVADGGALERALALGEQVAGFPWPTLLADRESTLEAQGCPLPEGMEREARRGTGTVLEGVAGAARFAEGEGRHGSGVEGTS